MDAFFFEEERRREEDAEDLPAVFLPVAEVLEGEAIFLLLEEEVLLDAGCLFAPPEEVDFFDEDKFFLSAIILEDFNTTGGFAQ